MVLKQNKILLLLFCCFLNANASENLELFYTDDSLFHTNSKEDVTNEYYKNIDSQLNKSHWKNEIKDLDFKKKRQKKETKNIDFPEIKGPNYKMSYFVIGIFSFIVLIILFVLIKNKRFKVHLKQNIKFEIDEINPNDVTYNELDELLKNALTSKNLRLSFRFNFLKILKLLLDKGLIVYRPNKTNNDYSKELDQHQISAAFNQIIRVFDEVWYGEKDFQLEEWNKIRELFILIENTIKDE